MFTGYSLLNGLTISFGFVLSLIALIQIIFSDTGEILFIISLLLVLLGLQGWQYIQTLVRFNEIKSDLDNLKREM